MESTLFQQDKLRDHKGRYCTKQQKRNDMLETENKWLRYERDKYFRSYMALSKRCTKAERELQILKNKIKELI